MALRQETSLTPCVPFSGLPDVMVENPALLASALARVKECMDFADVLHLGAAANCEAMLTIDRRFIGTASGDAVKVAEP